MLTEFRSRFMGKVSPVHFFWGCFDLACTRFSGRPAPTHPGGAPNCGDWVMAEALLARTEQLWFLARRRRGGRVLRIRLSRADGFADYPVGPADAFYDPATWASTLLERGRRGGR